MVVDEAPLMKEGVAMDNTHLTSGGPCCISVLTRREHYQLKFMASAVTCVVVGSGVVDSPDTEKRYPQSKVCF